MKYAIIELVGGPMCGNRYLVPLEQLNQPMFVMVPEVPRSKSFVYSEQPSGHSVRSAEYRLDVLRRPPNLFVISFSREATEEAYRYARDTVHPSCVIPFRLEQVHAW